MCWCLWARSACTPPILASVCGVGLCASARVLVAPRLSWLGFLGVCLLVCTLRLYPTTPGWGVRCGCVCLGSGFGCAPPLLAVVLGFVSACVRASLVPRHSWLGCAVRMCVLGLGFRLRPATPGWGVGVCVCLCARSACTPPLPAGVCGVRVCAWARVSAAPCQSRMGCAVFASVPGLGLRLRPATPSSGVGVCVCLVARSAFTPPLLAGVCGVGVCAAARVLAAPRHSWLGCCVCVCLWARPACTPPLLDGVCGVVVCAWAWVGAAPWHSWLGCWVCLCLWTCSKCTPQLLAGVCGVGVCAWAWVASAPRHSKLGCWGVCVFVCALRLYPAPPGWGLRPGCVCLGPGVGCALLLLAWALGCVCVFVCALRLQPATPGWVVPCACVCVGSGLGCAPPLHAGVLGRVCRCAPSTCTTPLLAGVCSVGLCAWAAPRHSLLGCWGVCVGVLRLLVPHLSCLGFVVRGLGFAWHLLLCCAFVRVVRAARVWGTRWLLLLGTCPCALVVASGVPLWRALWPRFGAPRLRADRSLSVLRSAFQSPRCLSPSPGLMSPDLLGGCVGHVEAGREPGSLCLPLAAAEAAALGSLCVVPVRGPAMGLFLAGPSGVGLGLRALRWFGVCGPGH